MSLSRWILFSPVAIIAVVGLAAHLASESASLARTAQGRAGASASTYGDVQQARSVDKALERAAARGRVVAELAADNTLNNVLFPPPASASSLNALKNARAASRKAAETEAERKEAEMKTAGAGRIAAKSTKTPASADARAAEHWVSPRYEAWKPAAAFGPPLPIERVRIQQAAHRLLQDLHAGRLSVMMDERDGEQLRCLLRDGVYCWPAPPPGVSIRSPRQRDVLEGTLEDEAAPVGSDRLLASRGTLPRRSPTANPADDPDFDPCIMPPAPGLLRMLTTLAAHSTPSRPLEIMSLLRPPYRFGGFVHVGPANPHSMGLGVDIAAYGGHTIRQSEPETCVAAVLALLRDLPPGRYRLGMPKAPEGGWDLPPALIALLNQPSAFVTVPSAAAPIETKSEAEPIPQMKTATGCTLAALYGLHVSSAKPIWPFFPPPFREVTEAETPDAPDETPAETQKSNTRKPEANKVEMKNAAVPRPTLKTVLRFQNEAYAPESALNDARLRNALEAARRRGADVIALFPDGADHVHIDVRQNP